MTPLEAILTILFLFATISTSNGYSQRKPPADWLTSHILFWAPRDWLSAYLWARFVWPAYNMPESIYLLIIGIGVAYFTHDLFYETGNMIRNKIAAQRPKPPTWQWRILQVVGGALFFGFGI